GDISRGLHQFAIRRDKLQPIDCFGDRHVTHLVVLITHHGSEVPSLANWTALTPNRVARIRSSVVGAPPRWRWPSTQQRVSFPVCVAISRATISAIPPSRNSPPSTSRLTCSPCSGRAPSATTTTVPK